MRRVRAGLGVTSFGIQVIELPPEFSLYPAHDHSHDEQEEVYLALTGRATLQVGEEELELEPGVFARVGPGSSGSSITGDEGARILAIGGTPGQGLEAPEWTEEGGSQPSLKDAAQLPLAGQPAQRNRSSARGRRRAAAPGPSSSVTRRPRPRTRRPASRLALSRTRSAAAATSSATAIAVAGELATVGVGTAAPVVERRQPRASDRDLGSGRAARRGRSCRRSPPPVDAASRRLDLGADPASRGVGVVGQQRDRAPSATFEASTPALAQTKPWRVSQIRTPRSARMTSLLSSSTSCTSAGSLPSSAASSAARSLGPDVDQAHAPGPPPWRRSSGRRRATSPGSSSAPLLRSARRAGRPRRSRASRRPRTTRSSRRHAAHSPSAPCGVAGRLAAAGLELTLGERRSGRRGCRGRGRASQRLDTRCGMPAARAACRWRAQLSRAERRADRVGRAEQQRVRSGAVAVGDDRPRRASGTAVERRSRSRGVEQRAVAGQQRDAGGSLRPARRRCRAGRLGMAGVVGVGRPPRRPMSTRDLLLPRLAADHDGALDHSRLADRGRARREASP